MWVHIRVKDSMDVWAVCSVAGVGAKLVRIIFGTATVVLVRIATLITVEKLVLPNGITLWS